MTKIEIREGTCKVMNGNIATSNPKNGRIIENEDFIIPHKKQVDALEVRIEDLEVKFAFALNLSFKAITALLIVIAIIMVIRW